LAPLNLAKINSTRQVGTVNIPLLKPRSFEDMLQSQGKENVNELHKNPNQTSTKSVRRNYVNVQIGMYTTLVSAERDMPNILLLNIDLLADIDNESIKIRKRTNGKLNILVFGGSLGSKFFSVSLVNSFIKLDPMVKKNIYIFHQVINSKVKTVKQLYKINNVISEVKSFFPNIQKYYKNTDLIICRAGGSTIAEILHLKIPCVIIPLKNSMDNHQVINSKIITSNKLGWVINENEFNSDTFIKIIEDITIKNLYLDKIKLNLEKYNNKNDRKQKQKSSNEIIIEIFNKRIIKLKKNDY